MLNAAADQIIPGGEGFPAPSEAGVAGFIARYTAPAGQEPTWFPFFGEEGFKRRLDVLRANLLQTDSAQQLDAMRFLEREEPEFFSNFRDLVYYGYYSRPEVTRAINEQLKAGRDYREAPQPYGYLDVIEDWDPGCWTVCTAPMSEPTTSSGPRCPPSEPAMHAAGPAAR